MQDKQAFQYQPSHRLRVQELHKAHQENQHVLVNKHQKVKDA